MKNNLFILLFVLASSLAANAQAKLFVRFETPLKIART